MLSFITNILSIKEGHRTHTCLSFYKSNSYYCPNTPLHLFTSAA